MQLTLIQVWTFATAFGIAALAGLAALLRSKQEIHWRNFLAAILYSGIIGLIISMLSFKYFEQNVPLLLAISGLSGIGGATTIDLVRVLLRGKLDIRVVPRLGDGDDGVMIDDKPHIPPTPPTPPTPPVN